MNDKERLKILSDAIRKMAAEAFHSEIVQTEMLFAELEQLPGLSEAEFKQDWIEDWIAQFLNIDLLEDLKDG